MGITGQYVKTFSEANLAVVVDIHLDADYPHVFFDVVAVDDEHDTVTLRSHSTGEELTLPIKQRGEREYTEITMSSSFEKLFRRPPTKFEITPLKGHRF